MEELMNHIYDIFTPAGFFALVNVILIDIVMSGDNAIVIGLATKDLHGKPDIVLRSRRIAVFVHGCFWQQHPDPSCKLARMPKSKLDFWRPKLEGNRLRDVKVRQELEALGWSVVEVWECQTGIQDLEALAARLKHTPVMNAPRTAESKSRSIVGAKAGK